MYCAGGRKEGRTFLGLGWGCNDEQQMRKSFGFGRDDFSRFIDLQAWLLCDNVMTTHSRQLHLMGTVLPAQMLGAAHMVLSPTCILDLQECFFELGYPCNQVSSVLATRQSCRLQNVLMRHSESERKCIKANAADPVSTSVKVNITGITFNCFGLWVTSIKGSVREAGCCTRSCCTHHRSKSMLPFVTVGATNCDTRFEGDAML